MFQIRNIALQNLFLVIFFLGIFLLSASTINAATRYVNSDSNGAATNPTRAFSDPSYTPNDSYQTLSAAYTAASAGDTLEISGGTGGKSYVGIFISKANLTLKGTTIINHSGTVTITYNAPGGAAIGTNASGFTIQNMTLTGSSTGHAFTSSAAGTTGKQIIFTDPGSSSYGISLTTGATGAYFENIVINPHVISSGSGGRGISLGASTGTSTFNNCVINGSTSIVVDINTGVNTSFTNCVFTAVGTISSNLFFARGANSTINTTNTLVQGPVLTPHVFIQGANVATTTWNSTNDIINGFPYFARTKANTGFLTVSVDDLANIDYFKTLANYSMSNYSIPLTFYVDNSNNLTAGNKTDLQTLYRAGHEIGVHTRHHPNLSFLAPFTVRYSGAVANIAIVVSASGTSLSATGTGDTHGPIDLTNASFDTVGELCTTINTWSNYLCTLKTDAAGSMSSSVLSTGLKDASTSLTIGVTTDIPFDTDTGPNNRYFRDEITNCINDLESALHEDPGSASYVAKTFAFPYTEASSQVVAWIKANTSLTGLRANNLAGGESAWLGAVDVFNIQKRPATSDMRGPNYSSLTTAQQQLRIEQAARVLATFSSNGFYTGFLTHNATEFSTQEFQWFIDEISKYPTAASFTISTFSNNVSTITTSGNWTGSAGVWSRTFTGADDFNLHSPSPLINAGIAVTGRTVDILGNSIQGIPDIGAYEYQPASSASVTQSTDGQSTPTCGDSAPTHAPDLFQINTTNNSAILHFAPAGTPYSKYFVSYGFLAGEERFGVEFDQQQVDGAITYPIYKLSPNTIYYFKVRGGNGCMPGAWSNNLKVKTNTQKGRTIYYPWTSFITTSFFSKLDAIPAENSPKLINSKKEVESKQVPSSTKTFQPAKKCYFWNFICF